MTKKAEGMGRSMVKWGLITGALIALFAPTAEASTTHPARTVHVVSVPAPTKAMRTALRLCAPAHKQARQACHSLALRPVIGDIPKGTAIVRECFGQARLEAEEWGAKHGRAYLKGCFEGNIQTP
jgi:hypothetical protein